MRIAALGKSTPGLSGGILMVLAIVDALRDLGHDARVVADQPAPAWAPFEVPWEVDADPVTLLREDELVLTGIAGVEPALAAGPRVVAHLCVGFEPHLWPAAADELLRVYRLPTLKLVIAPHLQRTLRREAGVDSVVVGAPIDLRPFAPGEFRERPPLRVLSVGSDPTGGFSPVPFKGIADVIEIVRRVRASDRGLELVRLTPREDELVSSAEVDELHVGVEPAAVPAIYRTCDIYVGGSTPAEGFGMPAVEAAASGLASVLPSIPSFSEVEELGRAALFYEPGDVEAAVRRLGQLMDDRALRRRLADAGPRLGLAERFSPRGVAKRIAAAFERSVA